MSWADRLEAWLGRSWDGRSRGRRGGLQPVEVGRALEAELLAGKRVSILHTYVPNLYRVFLHPQDWEALVPIQRTLSAEMTEYLRDVAEREQVIFVSPPQVQWCVAPEETPGRVRVEARFVEPAAEGSPAWEGGGGAAWEEPPVLEGGVHGSQELRAAEGPAGPGPAGEEVEEPSAPDPFQGGGGRWAAADEEPPGSVVASGPSEPQVEGKEATRRYRAVPAPEVEPSGRLVVVAGPDRGRSFPLRAPEQVIGRATGAGTVADLVLSDMGVSRRHARLLWRAGGWWLEDLGSTNGTYVNGEPVASAWIRSGDRLEVGNSEMILELEELPEP